MTEVRLPDIQVDTLIKSLQNDNKEIWSGRMLIITIHPIFN